MVYGENEAEYCNPIADNMTSLRDKAIFASENIENIYLGGVSIHDLIKIQTFKKDLIFFYHQP